MQPGTAAYIAKDLNTFSFPAVPRAHQSTAKFLGGALREARLLIVDDEPANVEILKDMLSTSECCCFEETTDPRQALPLYKSFQPDLILLDIMMPGMDGLTVLDQLQDEGLNRDRVPVLVLTADISPQTKRKALSKGAKDFLTKPFDIVELMLRINNLLENRFLFLHLQHQNETLEERVQSRTVELRGAHQRIAQHAEELEEAHFETLERLAWAGEFRDDDTGQHTYRVGFTTALLAEKQGYPPDRVKWIQQAARLHDVGKIGVSDLILLKPGKLTEEEFELMKTHTLIGSQVLEGGKTELIQIAQRIALNHHERWDGTGYPNGISGETIPIEARMAAVADVFDALTHDRPYKKAWPVAEAVAEIDKQSGKQFDPKVVDAFLTLDHQMLVG